MTRPTTRQHDDAFARLVAALSSANPLGSSARDWDARPERFLDAAAQPWNGPALRYDAEEHELSADAWRVSHETLVDARCGRIDAKLLRRSLGTRFRLERVLNRAAELHFLSGADMKRGPSVPPTYRVPRHVELIGTNEPLRSKSGGDIRPRHKRLQRDEGRIFG